jgi:HAD superfamily phosphatase (TIGR01668 family)
MSHEGAGREQFDKERVPAALRRLCPDIHVRRISELDPEDLKARGIRAVLLDLDNTLTPWRSHEVPPDIQEWLGRAQQHGLLLCMVSNSRNPRRLQALSERLAIPYVRDRMKPSRRGFVRAMELVGAPAGETAMAGDQLFTDVWGGNRAGLTTIWVDPLHAREFVGTKVSRLLERLVLWVFRRSGAR